jgi:hypothetical protein
MTIDETCRKAFDTNLFLVLERATANRIGFVLKIRDGVFMVFPKDPYSYLPEFSVPKDYSLDAYKSLCDLERFVKLIESQSEKP